VAQSVNALEKCARPNVIAYLRASILHGYVTGCIVCGSRFTGGHSRDILPQAIKGLFAEIESTENIRSEHAIVDLKLSEKCAKNAM